jgi:putative oxidoreductase
MTPRRKRRRRDWSHYAAVCARVALGASFLSGIADRFGLYRGRNVGYGDFEGFVRYTAKVNSFMPSSTIPFLAWTATAAELFFGIALILGMWRLWVALGSAVLLILFGTAMAISFGIKSPLDYSVFSASSAALLVAAYESRRKEGGPAASRIAQPE